MRASHPLPVVAVLSLALAGSAAAGVVRVDWREQAKVSSKPVIRFHVVALETETKGKQTGWAVGAEVTNTSTKPLRLGPNQFALVLFKNSQAKNPRNGKVLPAAAFSPALPVTLAPGKTWRGTFAGPGSPANGSYVRVLFGWFSGPAVGGSGFNWLSDHVRRWCPGKCFTYGA